MFLSRLPDFVHTVKFKIALLCAALYMLASLFCFFLVFGGRYSAVSQRIDPILKGHLDALECEYLTGMRWEDAGRRQPVAQIPPGIMAELRQRHTGFEPVAFYRKSPEAPALIVGEAEDGRFLVRTGRSRQLFIRRLEPVNHLPLVRKSMRDRAGNTGHNTLYFTLRAANGVELGGSSPGGGSSGRSNFRVATRENFDGSVFEAGYNRAVFDDQYSLFYDRLMWVLLVLPVPGFIIGWIAADRLLTGINRVVAAARRIAGGDFSQRVTKSGEGREIGELIDTFNLMNANTEELLTQLRSVTDDVAHDLRTPITRIRGLAEITVQGEPRLSAYRDALGNIAEECDAMVAMINTTLEIARAESRLTTIDAGELDLSALLTRAFEIFQPEAEERDLEWRLELPPEPVRICGDRLRLERLTANLLDNAVKFLEPGSRFTLRLTATEREAVITAADNGAGIPDAVKPKIFDRYFRLDSSRSRRGNGLGLAMVRAFARLHGGDAVVTDTPGGGATFVITLAFRPPESAAG